MVKYELGAMLLRVNNKLQPTNQGRDDIQQAVLFCVSYKLNHYTESC